MHWMGRHRLLIIALICALCTGGVLLGHFFSGLPFLSGIWTSEQTFEDFMQREGRKTATRPDFVFLGIDQSTLQLPPFLPEETADNRALQLMTEKSFPWSREVWAIMLDQLFAAGARLVIFDIVFSPTNEGDPAFKAALDRHRDRVVLGANFDFSAVDQGGGGGFAQNVPPNPSLIPPPAMADDRVGYVAMFPDPIDGKIRAARYTITDLQLALQPARQGEVPYSALATRALEKLGQSERVPRDLKSHRFRFTDPNAYQPRPIWQIFDRKFWRQNYGDGAFFKDKVVLIGSSAQIVHDVFPTPMGPETPGPLLHFNAIAAALGQEFLTVTPARLNWFLVGAAGVLAGLLVGFVRRPSVTIISFLGVAIAYLGLSRVLYDQSGLLLLVVPVLAAFWLSGSLSLGFEYALERLEKQRTRRTLERYVSKNLVKEILENPGGYYNSLLGSRKPATMLFSDIVGFTTLTEKADPEALVTQLNEYLTRMVAVVFKNNGTLDKFIGDAVMAVWGNVKSLGTAEDAKSAARTALGMWEELNRLNEKWGAEDKTKLGIGIGINQGEVLIGNIGSDERMEATVIGDAVNLASRLEGLTRTYGVDILVGPTASDLIRDSFILRTVARVQVKGKTQPVEISSLLGERGKPFDEEFLRWLESYEEGIREFRGRNFEKAKILFERFLEFYPDDVLAKNYLERALEYEKTPPDASWTAAEVFTKK